MKYIDIKVSVWNRIQFSEDADMNKIANLIEFNGLESVMDKETGYEECSTLFETEQPLALKSNDEYSTIEVYDGQNVI